MTEPVRVPWADFARRWPSLYRQDQHVTIIGPTGSGKTVLATELVKPRGYVVALSVKYHDRSMERLEREGWDSVREWKNRPKNSRRIIVAPKEKDLDKVQDVHHSKFKDVYQSVYRTGAWCIWTDELTYLSDMVGLKKYIRQMYILARSAHVSMVGSAQRPAFVPLEAYSQASHLFLFRTGDERDLARMGSLNGTSAKQVAATVATLPKHVFLYVNLETGEQVISMLELER